MIGLPPEMLLVFVLTFLAGVVPGLHFLLIERTPQGGS